MRKIGKICRKKNRWNIILWIFSQGKKNILVVLEIPDNIWYFLKTKGVIIIIKN